MLSVKDIAFNYAGQQYFKGIRNVSLQLREGEILGIVGKSGSGKTTLLKCIYGLEDLLQGEVSLEGRKVLGPSYNLIPGYADMKLVSQDFYVLDNHTVEENITDKLTGYTNEAKELRSAKILKLLELQHLKNIRAKLLSSGQKQRVAIARALAVMPKVMLLDEPFSNLDKPLTEKLYAFITAEVKKRRTAVILVTHVAEEALKYSGSLAVMDDGRIVQTGETWQVYYQPGNKRLAGLLGDYNWLRAEDFEKSAGFKAKAKVFLRPDKILQATPKGPVQIYLDIISCVFNGKCYELLAETKSGRLVTIYSGKKLPLSRRSPFRVETEFTQLSLAAPAAKRTMR